MLERINKAADFIRERFNPQAKIGIVLGSGLGDFAEEIEVIGAVNYSEIPFFPVSEVPGHAGRLIYGEVKGKKVLAMQGRFHYYEGFSMAESTIHIRVFKLLGIDTLLVSNAAGGLNKSFQVGDLMMISDHINFFGDNPLRGKNIDEFGPRFPAMNDAYSPRLRSMARQIAQANGMNLQSGVYIGVAGPNFETQAELHFFGMVGADAVGMSTVPEVIVARHCGLEVFGMSIITNMAIPGLNVEASHDEVQDAAKITGPKVKLLFEGLIEKL